METQLNNPDLSKLDYAGELTLEALATLDTYMKSCCNSSETARRLHKKYMRVRHYLQQPYVREIFQLKLLEKGVTPEKIADVIKSGIEATRNVYSFGSKVAEDPDWLARQKFVQLAAEIFEVLKYHSKTDVNVNSVQNTFIYNNIKEIIEHANIGRAETPNTGFAAGAASPEKLAD